MGQWTLVWEGQFVLGEEFEGGDVLGPGDVVDSLVLVEFVGTGAGSVGGWECVRMESSNDGRPGGVNIRGAVLFE